MAKLSASLLIKLTIRWIMFILGIVIVIPLILLTWVESIICGKKTEFVYGSCKEVLSLCPTIIGQYMRLGYYFAVCKKISPYVCFMFGSIIAHRDTIIRSGTTIGCYTILGYTEVGENVLFGARVSVLSGKYQHGKPNERSKNQMVSEEYTKIKIGNNSWIGEGALILADIGSNCSIGAGSAVYKEAPNGATMLGNPARKVSF